MPDSFEENVTEAVTSDHQNTNKSITQVSEDSHDKGAPTKPDNWQGNPDYFQSGKKAGQLKPRALAAKDKKEFSGLNLDNLQATPSDKSAQPAQPEAIDKKALKLEKKIVEAKIASKFVMRILDTLTSWISGGTYGANFTEPQRKERNKYREELEQDWQDYLVTLDIPMHPAIVAIFGSMLYVAPAFETDKGKERAQSIKEKLIGKAVGMFFRKKT